MTKEAPKFPYSFERTMTKTNVDRRNSILELSSKDSKACWALRVKREVRMVVDHQQQELEGLLDQPQQQVEWRMRWWSGRKAQRADRIYSSCWDPFMRTYKLAYGDVVVFTLLSPSRGSLRILRCAAPAKASLAMIPSSSAPKSLPALDQPPLLQQSVVPGACRERRSALCYLKLQQSHMQGKPFLLDLPTQFKEQLTRYGWSAAESSAGCPNYSTLISQALLADEAAGIGEGDLCIFELIQDATCKSTLHLYVYKKDQGQPCFLVSL